MTTFTSRRVKLIPFHDTSSTYVKVAESSMVLAIGAEISSDDAIHKASLAKDKG